MTDTSPDTRPARGTIDAEGRLIAADPTLSALQVRAGGEAGGPLAIPQLAALSRLALRLGIVISRGVVAGDGDEDLSLWVRAAPDGKGGAELAITHWREAPARGPTPAGMGAREHDFARADADWAWECDEQLRLTALSPDAAAALGDVARALIGETVTMLFTLEPDRSGVLAMLDAMGQMQPFVGQAARLRGPEGRAVVLSGVPLRGGDKRFAGFRGTARWQMPDEAGEDAGFGAAIGEALRAPLDRIIAAADAIRSERDGPIRANYAEYAGDIADAGRHLRALIGDLVDLQAVENPGFRLATEPFDLAETARRAAALLAARAADRGVQLLLSGGDAALVAEGDPRRALQILVNLIGNAVRYSPTDQAVEILLSSEGGVARVAVIDRGKGIAAEDQARIFDKFERVDPTEPGGTGLGLYIARRFARAMGGEIVVESAAGEGARFTLSLRAA